MGDTELLIYGFHHLLGRTVAVAICGIDCGNYQVDDLEGFITVPFESDLQGMLTRTYVASCDGYEGEHAMTLQFYHMGVLIEVTVPVVVGVMYYSRGQTVRPATQADVRSPTGPGLGLVRHAYGYAAMLNNTPVGAVMFGTKFTGYMDPAPISDDAGEVLDANELFTGVISATLEDGFSFDGMLAWQAFRPLPVTVTAVSAFIVAEEPN